MGCWPPPSQQLESEITSRRNPQSDSGYDDHALVAIGWWDWPADRIARAIPLLVKGDVTALEAFAAGA